MHTTPIALVGAYAVLLAASMPVYADRDPIAFVFRQTTEVDAIEKLAKGCTAHNWFPERRSEPSTVICRDESGGEDGSLMTALFRRPLFDGPVIRKITFVLHPAGPDVRVEIDQELVQDKLIGVDHFEEVTDEDFEDVRQMIRDAGATEWTGNPSPAQ